MTLLILSFIAGVLTVLAPCVLPMLPVIVGGAISGNSKARKPYVIIASLVISVVAFTLILKVSTAFIAIPQSFWAWVSGLIIIFVGLTLAFPGLWEKLPFVGTLSVDSNKLLGMGYQKKNFWGDVIMGAALGPVFSSCSPTYFVIIATVLPASFGRGIAYLFAYAIGLGLVLLLISVLGQKLVDRLGLVSNPNGWFKKIIGILFILVGIFIISGWDKMLESGILNKGFFDVTSVETKLLEAHNPPAAGGFASGQEPVYSASDASTAGSASASSPASAASSAAALKALLAWKAAHYQKYHEIVDPAGFINTDGQPIKISDYIGKKVVLLDFIDYSCIDCQRTVPYLEAWWNKYQDQGLEVIAIHTPEFAFEKDPANVAAAMKQLGITFPVVLDNNYATWNAYGNEYWPHKYLIDIDGYVDYDYIGEGNYPAIEQHIQAALNERAQRLGTAPVATGTTTPTNTISYDPNAVNSPETYFGSERNEYLGDGMEGTDGSQTLTIPPTIQPNALYLGGTWNFQPQYAESSNGTVTYEYDAKNVYMVATSTGSATVQVYVDGQLLTGANRGSDVSANGTVTIQADRLYNLVSGSDYGTHTIQLKVVSGTLQAYTFTFG